MLPQLFYKNELPDTTMDTEENRRKEVAKVKKGTAMWASGLFSKNNELVRNNLKHRPFYDMTHDKDTNSDG
ncbi:hypothetical protein TNCV_4520191 [Trichonephila clavipes]|nr:hypothetical protein TNCV_4520191 [Trichonephila clavipes]